MAYASTLLKLTPLHQWNPTFSYTQRNNHHNAHSLFFSKPQRKPNLIRLQISYEHKQLKTDARYDSAPALIWKNSSHLIPVRIKKAVDLLKKPAVAVVLLGFLLFYRANFALARSGSAFSSPSSSSSSHWDSSSSSSSSPSRSSSLSSYSSWWPSSSSSSPSPSSSASSFSSSSSSDSELSFASLSFCFLNPDFLVNLFFFSFFFSFFVIFITNIIQSLEESKTSVVKLQVGFLGSGKTIQQDFNRLVENVDISTNEGLKYVLTEATLALLRYPDYCISCYSSVDVKRGEEGEKRFNRLSIDERVKFDEETLVNVNGIKIKSSKIQRASDFSNEYIVVTILVAANGTIQKLQPINRIADLKEALLILGSLPISRIMAVEILWTPQDENEALSEIELLEDYLLLKPF